MVAGSSVGATSVERLGGRLLINSGGGGLMCVSNSCFFQDSFPTLLYTDVDDDMNQKSNSSERVVEQSPGVLFPEA